MIILDTCALIFDALTPQRLSKKAIVAIKNAELQKKLFCCSISLWEIAMLSQKQRLDVGTDVENFLQLAMQARSIQVLAITSAIAVIAASSPQMTHGDPADRIIAATALQHNATLITCDKKLQEIHQLSCLW